MSRSTVSSVTAHSAPGPAPPAGPDAVCVRPAVLADLDALLSLEARCFETDRITRRGFRRFLTLHRADCTLALVDGRPVGYALTVYRSGTALARLYSIAVAPEARGRGLGLTLLHAAEAAALDRDCVLLRLEVRPDNAAALTLYRRLGYRTFARVPDYYEDHSDALRLQRALRPAVPPHRVPPYHAQSTDFTCGPAALMMALAAQDPALVPDRRLEFRLWREATTIFMCAGHGGCEPVGLALAAARRGFPVSVHASQSPPYFLDSVRDPDKREVMVLTQDDFREQAATLSIPIHDTALTMADVRAALDDGRVALLLVSHYRMLGDRTPHWVLVFGHDARRAFVHDPWVEPDDYETPLASADLPIPWAELERMARYGRRRLQAALLIGTRDVAATHWTGGAPA